MASASEQTPLLQEVASGPRDGPHGPGPDAAPDAGPDANNNNNNNNNGLLSRLVYSATSLEHRLLVGSALMSLSFTLTQVPLFYAIRALCCEDYYDTHLPYTGPGDRCSTNAIAAYTSSQYALTGISTGVCGVMNLILTGALVKKSGPRFALLCQITVACIRVLIQICGLLAGGKTGIVVFQVGQLVTVLGGPLGYNLVLNILVGEIVAPMRRTIVFGHLTGWIMLGMGSGYYFGSLIGEHFQAISAFQAAAVSFLVSNLYILAALPYIAPGALSGARKDAATGLRALVAPFKVLAPQTVCLSSGKIAKHYGVRYLCAGVFIGSVATTYVPLLVQQIAAEQFSFSQGENGVLMSGYFLLRSGFLMVLFPRIISAGRAWYVRQGPGAKRLRLAKVHMVPAEGQESTGERTPILAKTLVGVTATAAAASSETPTLVSSSQASTTETEDAEPPVEFKSAAEQEQVKFDLLFLQGNLFFDGLLTTGSAFATEKWHLYLADFMLPLASGSAPAAKGVITEMAPASQRADALSMLQLSDNIAQVTTLGFFGLVFSALAAIGKSHLTFFINAAVAVVGVGVLLFSHFPPPGSRLVEDGEENQE